ncbi:hypothetical protein HHX47_DHR1002054 [Lentinula edodes]|nr:hypothetical protein HHX47_DHR1002054 [Lentinula edodes]
MASPRGKLFKAIRTVPSIEGLKSFFSRHTQMSRLSKGGRSDKRKISCHCGEPIPFLTVVRAHNVSLNKISQYTSKSIGSGSDAESLSSSSRVSKGLLFPRLRPWMTVKSTWRHIRYEPPSVGKNHRPYISGRA